jgi:hypothetical protein
MEFKAAATYLVGPTALHASKHIIEKEITK